MNRSKLNLALRTLKVGCVPWSAIVAATVEGRLPAMSLKPKGKLGERLGVLRPEVLLNIVKGATTGSPMDQWVGNFGAAEILGTNEVAVWRLTQAGMLKRHAKAPAYSPFKRSEVRKLARQVIFTPEIIQLGGFVTYRSASTWCSECNIVPIMELKKGGWKLYPRAQVERALKKRPKDSAKPLRIGNAYPKEIKQKLLARVRSGTSVYRAATACNVNYTMAKTWVRTR